MLLVVLLSLFGRRSSGFSPPVTSPSLFPGVGDRVAGSKPGFFVVETWVVPELEEGPLPAVLQRLDAEIFPTGSRARKACRKGEILLNGTVARCINVVRPFDVVERQLRFTPAYYPNGENSPMKAPFQMDVAYEDDYFGVVVKPAGPPTYTTHGQGGGRSNVRSALPFALTAPSEATEGCLRRPQPCHRLDAATSGLLVAAKTKPALLAFHWMFAERRIRKTYVAIIRGEPLQRKGVIDSPLLIEDKKKRKVEVSAVTEYEVLGTFVSLKAGKLSRIRLRPKTGRTHQLRRHCSEFLGCPIVGDVTYDGGSPEAVAMRGSGLFLCSTELEFDHPFTHAKMHVTIDEPPKFASLVTRELKRAEKFLLNEQTD